MSIRFVDFILFYCYHYAFTVFSSLVFSVTVITVCAQLFLSVVQSVIALAQKAKDEKLQLQLEDHRQLQQQQHSSLEHRGKVDTTNVTAVDPLVICIASSTCCTASTTTASRILTISTATESVVQENNDNRKQQQQQQQQQQLSGQQQEVVNYALLGTIKVRTSSDALCELLSGYQESDNTTATTTCLESPIIMSPVNISPGSKRKQSFSPSSKHLQKISSSSSLLSVTTGSNNRCCSKSNHDYDRDDDGNNYDDSRIEDSRIEDSRIDDSINHIVDTHNCHDVNDYLNHNHFVSTNSVDNEDDEDYEEKVVDVIKEGKSKVENSIGAVLGLSSAADRGARIISPVLGKD